MLAQALEHLVRGIVDNPDDVTVTSRSLRRGGLLEVRVDPEDLGRVIGRSGRTARALRTVIGALADTRCASTSSTPIVIHRHRSHRPFHRRGRPALIRRGPGARACPG